MNNNLGLTYMALLSQVKQACQKKEWELNRNTDESERTEKIKIYIQSQISYLHLEIDNMDHNELVQRLYDDIEGFSVLSAPLADDDVYEIHICSWREIVVTTLHGVKRSGEPFYSPSHCRETVSKFLSSLGADVSSGSGFAQTKQYSAYACLINEDVSMFVRKNAFMGNYDEKLLAIIDTAIMHGVSVLSVAPPSIDMSAFIEKILSALPESGVKLSYDYSLTPLSVKNHMRCAGNISTAFRLRPDVLACADIKEAVELANKGQTVLSCANAGSIENAYRRYGMQAANAFPLCVFLGRTADMSERIMCVSEIVQTGERYTQNVLYTFEVEENIQNDTFTETKGEYKKISEFSQGFKIKLKQNGITKDELNKIM